MQEVPLVPVRQPGAGDRLGTLNEVDVIVDEGSAELGQEKGCVQRHGQSRGSQRKWGRSCGTFHSVGAKRAAGAANAKGTTRRRRGESTSACPAPVAAAPSPLATPRP